MFDAGSDPDDIAEEIGFLCGLLDYEGAREAAKLVLARVVTLAAKQTANTSGRRQAELTADLIFNMASDVAGALMPLPHSEQGSSATVATG